MARSPRMLGLRRSGLMSLAYPIGTSGETVVISNTVLDHLCHHRQMRWWQREAGGLLFARFEGANIQIVEATGPRSDDARSRYRFAFRLERQQAVVDERFGRGLHYVGDWHSHPEARPQPSPRDLQTMGSRVRESIHGFGGFLFAIIGCDPLPAGLAVLLHDGVAAHRLSPKPLPVLTSNLNDARSVQT